MLWRDHQTMSCWPLEGMQVGAQYFMFGLNLPHLLGMRVSVREYLWVCVHVVCFMYRCLLRAQILRRASGKSP